MLSSPARHITIDADGNMTSRTVGSDVTSYEWSDLDSLIAIEHPNGDKVVNLYDADGLRKERVFDDGEKVKSFFSGLPTVNESSSNGNSFSFLMGHQLMGFEDQSGNFRYFVTDGLSSVRLVLNSSGTAVASFEHDEFGNELAASGSSLKTYVGGLGVHDDSEKTNLLYMRARHYDPTLGRFLNRDPIGFAGGLNLFNYPQNPVSRVDATGLEPTPTPTPLDRNFGPLRIVGGDTKAVLCIKKMLQRIQKTKRGGELFCLLEARKAQGIDPKIRLLGFDKYIGPLTDHGEAAVLFPRCAGHGTPTLGPAC